MVVITGMRLSLQRQRLTRCCNSLRHACFSSGSCSQITGRWQWQAAQAPRGEVWIVTCACTQDSWWLQQQFQHFMSVSRVQAYSHGFRPSLELIQAVLCLLWAVREGIPSPCTPQNNGLLTLRQFQTFSQTPSLLTVAHLSPSACVHAANHSPLPGI